MFSGEVDVIVCDGFVGNIALKICEGLALQIFEVLKKSLKSSLVSQFGAMLSQGAFKGLKKKIDYTEYGGAPLLGFNGLVFKAHGSARDRAVTSAIRVTAQTIKNQIGQIIARDIAAANIILAAEAAAENKA